MNRMDILEYAIRLAKKELERKINYSEKKANCLRGLVHGLEIANIIMTEDFPDKNMRNLVRMLIEKFF